MSFQQPPRKLLMIPGPTEFDSDVLSVLGEPSPSHVAPDFIAQFSRTLKSLRSVLVANNDCQPFILSGGGSLGWDCIVSSLCDSDNNDRALILNTGYFSDNFSTCCDRYGIKSDHIRTDVGNVITPEILEQYLQSEDVQNKINSYKLVCITHVDTSTAVVNPVAELSKIIRKYCNPNTLIAVDGVCSFAGEEFYFSDWDIDACMTASQKALGCPPGLCVLMLSKNAVNVVENRKNQVKSFYCDLNNWLPIMRKYEAKEASYFSTPNTNLIKALDVSCNKLLKKGMKRVFDQHNKMSNAFKDGINALGLGFVPKERKYMANTLTAVRYPKDINGKELLTRIKEKNVIFAGGLHREIKTEYFRIGHMGISVDEGCDHLIQSMIALEYGLNKVGYRFQENIGVDTLCKKIGFDLNAYNDECKNCGQAHYDSININSKGNTGYGQNGIINGINNNNNNNKYGNNEGAQNLRDILTQYPIVSASIFGAAGVALGYFASKKSSKNNNY